MGRIQDFINKNSSSTIRVRAKELARLNFIRSFNYHSEQKLITATVTGNMTYNVTVDLSRKVKITSYCNCPYDWGGLCKHQVAVLMKYEEDEELYEEQHGEEEDIDLPGSNNTSINKYFGSDDNDYNDEEEEELPPAIIKEYEDITIHSINKTANIKIISRAKLMIDFVEIHAYSGGSSIEFMIEDKASYYAPVDYAEFSLTKNGLEAKCTCDEYVPFCSHIIAVLLLFNIKNDKPGFFKFLDVKGQKEELTFLAAKYGITGVKDIKQVLELRHDEHQIYYHFINKYKGLQPVEKNQLEQKKCLNKKIMRNLLPSNVFYLDQ